MAKQTNAPTSTVTLQEPPIDEQALELAQQGELAEVSTLSGMFEADSGGGMEGVGANDFSLPFITILQKGSPQVSRANAKYIKDASAGMIMNTVSGSTYPGETGIIFIPCGFQKKLVHWTSRDSGGGFLGHMSENDPVLRTAKVNDRGQLELPDKTLVIDTAYHFGLVIPDEGEFPEFGIVSMYSTGLKISRNWNTMMRGIMMRGSEGRVFNPPTYSHMYRLTTKGMQKDSYDWYAWNVISEGQVSNQSIYEMAKSFSKMVAEDKVRISKPTSDFEAEGAPVGDAPKVAF